jgi:amino acid transporter/nucleotide-binding universal stress UspA family protein
MGFGATLPPGRPTLTPVQSLILDRGATKPAALTLLAGERPRNVGWRQAAGLLFGDWGTSRLYVLGLAFAFAGGASVYLIGAMSLLVLAVGWAYTQICRIYPDGGGVYTAARRRSPMLGVIGALLLFADYVVTASLSALDAFHYFGLGHTDALLAWNSPGLWAIVAVAVIGAFNLLGPRHTGRYAVAAAVAMVAMTLLITAFALPQVDWASLPQRVGPPPPDAGRNWLNFVAIVLALSGVEAIGNLTGVMRKPVAVTSRRAIWVVAVEVALFNVLLALCMVARLSDADQGAHKEDMLAFLSGAYVGHWAEIGVRVVGGLLLLSAVNTVVTDMISVQYLLSRDGELPAWFQKLNPFGVPWLGAAVATAVPCIVLVFSHDLEHLAALYAIGVVGAVAINVTLVSTHPRLRGLRRKAPMLALGLLLIAIWLTLAYTKPHALAFVTVVMVVGLALRALTKHVAARRPKPSLLRRAIMEQLPADALARKKILLATAGSDRLADEALDLARAEGATLVVTFIRPVALSYKVGAEERGRFTLDTDPAAQNLFRDFLEHGHRHGVPVVPMYDVGPNAPELIAEFAALNGVDRVLIGSSRRGTLHQILKGSFQRRLESLLPPEIPVQVVGPG